MTVHVDTSALVAALTEPHAALDALTRLVDERHRVAISSLVLYEWLRGPRTLPELRAQEALFPRAAAVPFDAHAARIAARLYAGLPRASRRASDLAVAASAMSRDAAVWTLNKVDFEDIPGLRLV